MDKTNKAHYLDGLRGTAAMMVLLHHFSLAFYISHYNREPATLHTNGIEIWYYKNIISVLTNGNFAVCIFFVLSGLVLSRKYFETNKYEVLVSAASRRFLRLYIPVAFSLIIAYIVLQAGLMYNRATAEITLSRYWLNSLWDISDINAAFTKSLLYSVMFQGDAACNTAVWTMQIEFFGSLMVYALLALTHQTKNKTIPILALCIFLISINAFYQFAFIVGICFNYLEQRKRNIPQPLKAILVAVLFALGLLFGSYPTHDNIQGMIFEKFPFVMLLYRYWFHTAGACMLVASIVMSERLQSFFSLRMFRFLGNISFSLYLLHPIILVSAGCFTFLKIYPLAGYNTAALIALIVFMATTIVASVFMTRYIDNAGIRFSAKLYEKYFKKEWR